MIAWLLALAFAADPAALRQVRDGSGVVDVSTDAIGVAAYVGPVDIGVDYAYGVYVAGNLGWRRRLTGADRSWGIDAVATAGLAGLMATPGVALLGSGELRGGLRHDHAQATVGLVVPLAVRLDVPPQVAVPMGLELRLAAKLGPLFVGARGQAGGTLSVGGVPAGRAVAGGFIGWGPSGSQ